MKKGKRWVRITQSENIPLREGRSVKVGSREIAIFNLGDRFLAVDNRCPHNGGPLSEGIVSGSTVVCPLHAWKVNLETGESAGSGGAPQCLETFQTRVEAGVILIELPFESAAKEDSHGACVDRAGSASWLESEARASR